MGDKGARDERRAGAGGLEREDASRGKGASAERGMVMIKGDRQAASGGYKCRMQMSFSDLLLAI